MGESRYKRNMAWVIGIGIALLAIHNRWLTLTDSSGITWIFLPQLGMSLSIIGVLMIIMVYKKKVTWGSKWLYIPLLIIAASIAIADMWQYAVGTKTLMQAGGSIVFALYLVGIYLSARILKEALFRPFLYITIIVSMSCVVMGLMHFGVKTGGLASPTNYDMATGLMVFGLLVSAVKHQWWLSAVVLAGLVFTGAEEAIVAIVVLAVAVLIRRDWSKKLLLPVGVITIIVIGGLLLPHNAHRMTLEKPELLVQIIKTPTGYVHINSLSTIVYDGQEYREQKIVTKAEALDYLSGYRYLKYWRISELQPFGYGYNISNFNDDANRGAIPHNVFLVITEQVGLIAALAWLFVVGYCLVKTRYKYAFIGLLALAVFDHYYWTQVAPWFWALVGVASASLITSDKIFREVKGNDKEVHAVVVAKDESKRT